MVADVSLGALLVDDLWNDARDKDKRVTASFVHHFCAVVVDVNVLTSSYVRVCWVCRTPTTHHLPNYNRQPTHGGAVGIRRHADRATRGRARRVAARRSATFFRFRHTRET